MELELREVTANAETWNAMWTQFAFGIILWLLGLFWIDAFDMGVTRTRARVITAPPCLPLMECNVQVEYLDDDTRVLKRAWIGLPMNRSQTQGDIVSIRYGPNIKPVLDERSGKPPVWVGKIVCGLGTLSLIFFVVLFYTAYL